MTLYLKERVSLVRCNKCEDQTEYELYQDNMEHWRIGLKLDINVYKEHICPKKETGATKYWCFDCGAGIRYANPCIHRRQKLNPETKVGYF